MQMNKCIDQEDMLAFAMDPLLPENVRADTVYGVPGVC